jgi:hypothetical protein
MGQDALMGDDGVRRAQRTRAGAELGTLSQAVTGLRRKAADRTISSTEVGELRRLLARRQRLELVMTRLAPAYAEHDPAAQPVGAGQA